MTLTVAGMPIDFDPGQTYTHTDGTEQSKADARIAAVKLCQDAIARTTRGALTQAVAQVTALSIQLRAVNGSAADTSLGHQLREAADFLEDL